MSVPMVASEVAFDRRPPVRSEPEHKPVPLTVIREMLLMLDSLTIAGQRHLMEKVVHFAQDQLPRLGASLGRRNLSGIEAIINQLKREADRLVPDVSAFSRGAEALLALLVALE